MWFDFSVDTTVCICIWLSPGLGCENLSISVSWKQGIVADRHKKEKQWEENIKVLVNINYVQKPWNSSLDSLYWDDAKNLTYYFKILTKNLSPSTVVFLNRSSFQANGALEFLWLL